MIRRVLRWRKNGLDCRLVGVTRQGVMRPLTDVDIADFRRYFAHDPKVQTTFSEFQQIEPLERRYWG